MFPRFFFCARSRDDKKFFIRASSHAHQNQIMNTVQKSDKKTSQMTYAWDVSFSFNHLMSRT